MGPGYYGLGMVFGKAREPGVKCIFWDVVHLYREIIPRYLGGDRFHVNNPE